MIAKSLLCAVVVWAAAPWSLAGDWTNSGGNAARNGLSSERGPAQPDLLWSGGRPSIIGWQPVTEGGRVFMVRQAPFPPGSDPNDSPVVAMDLSTGAELWTLSLPFESGEWTTWIAGVNGGRVYATRAGNCSAAKLYALDAATGAIVWASQDKVGGGGCDADAYEGVVFAPNGDPVFGGLQSVRRFSSVDGTIVWKAPRQCPIGGACGVALFGKAVYAVEASGISRFDLSTGARQYSSGESIGFGQGPPMVGSDGTIYTARPNNGPGANFFYAFRDTGTALEQKWKVPMGLAVVWEFGVGPDGSIYMLGQDASIERLDPLTGTVVDRSQPLAAQGEFLQPRIAIDARGRVFVSNGSFSDGRLFAFDAGLKHLWDVPVPNVNIGGPALGSDGTLVICGVGTDVRAYRAVCDDEDTDGFCCLGDTEGGAIADACCDSDMSKTVVVEGCDSGVPNSLSAEGCTINDQIAQCDAGARNHGQFVRCVAHLTNALQAQGVLTGEQASRIKRCVAHEDQRTIRTIRPAESGVRGAPAGQAVPLTPK